MPHPDADDLALFAIGEQPDPELAAHVTNCAQCTADIVRWRDTADLARQADLPGWVPAPPPGLWAKIVAELDLPAGDDLASGAVATGRRTAALGAVPDLPTSALPDPPTTAVPDAPAPPDEATPGPDRRPSRWRRLTLPIAAGLAGLLIGAGVVFAIQRSPSPTVEKSATLIGLPSGWPEVDPNQPVGDAQLVNVDGNRQLQVETGPLPAIPGSYEVWLIATPERMVSLGVLTDGSGTFTVPAGIDTTDYALVDISDEPADGNPVHSGDSIARGALG